MPGKCMFDVLSGRQYASFLVTKVQFGVSRHQRMVVFLCRVGLILRKAFYLMSRTVLDWLGILLTLVDWFFTFQCQALECSSSFSHPR